MQELISNLINTFNIILKEHLDETKYDKSISVDDVKNYLDELAIDIYAIKRIENYLEGVDISPELTELIKQFKMVIAFNEEQNVFDKEQLDKYRQIGVYDSIRSRLLRKIYLLKQDKKAKEFCLRNKQECLRLISFLNKLDGTRIIGERNLYRFYNFLNRLELPAEQLFEINMLLLQYNISVDSNLELNTKQDIVESITSFNLTKEQAIQIFENYGYDFNLVDTTIKEDLLAFGTMDGLNSMFMYFKEI